MFASRNNGLACLCPNFFAQHPTDPGILMCGLQDNGTARTSGGPIWKHVFWGDGGYCQFNWADPQQVVVFMNGNILRATDGGQDHDSWEVSVSAQAFPWATMIEPVVAPPYNPSSPTEADIVAVGGDKASSFPGISGRRAQLRYRSRFRTTAVVEAVFGPWPLLHRHGSSLARRPATFFAWIAQVVRGR